MADRTYEIPVSNGILSPAHVQGIGNAVFEFLWCIDRTTKESPTEDGSALEGLVLGGNPIRANTIAMDLGLKVRTVHKHLQDLVTNGYLRNIDYGVGVACGYAVVKSKKWRRNLDQLTPQDSANPRQNLRTFAENGEPPQDSANPRQNLQEVRRKRRGVRQIRQPYIETEQDNTKTNTKAKAQAPFVVPDWVPKETWKAFEEMRKKKRAEMTDWARELIVRELDKLRAIGHDSKEVLERSIRNGWKDVYAPTGSAGSAKAQPMAGMTFLNGGVN